jgi:ribonucleoside-diphosphate reductase alpha chain
MFEWKQELSKEIFTKKYLINQGDVDIDQVFRSVSEEIASVEKTKEKQEYWKDVFYKELINKRFIPAGRIIANARPYSKVKNYNNCFAIEIKDSMEGIFSALKDDALIQKQGGGVGFSLSHLRPKGATITAGGESSGPLSFLRIFNESAKSIHTGGGRRGAHIATLDISHPDIEEFITCKHGDKNKEFTQFNLSVCITDKFIDAVKHDLDWNLEFEGKIYKTVKAKYLYELMTKNAFVYAEPGILCVDTINKESNVSYIGSCEQTNPCVIGSTKILTDKGYIPIINLIGKETNIWNGFEWSKVIPKKTGKNQELMKVQFSSGQELICTPYHKFILNNDTRVEAKNLKIGDKLAKCNYPIIEGTKELTDQEAYLQGFYSGDGYYETAKKSAQVYFYEPKKMCMKRCGYIQENIINTKIKRTANVFNIDKSFVPNSSYTIKTRLSWLAGILDSDGCINGSNYNGFTISSINKQFLLDIQLMLQTLGCNSKVLLEHTAQKKIMPDGKGGQKEYQCQSSYRLTISKYYITNVLYKLGLKTERLETLNLTDRNSENFTTIKNIIKLDYKEDVYCVTELKNHSVIFEGIFTGNCGEVPLLPYESCNLGSLKLSTFVINPFKKHSDIDWNQLEKSIKIAIKFLDNNLDASAYPLKRIEHTVKSLRRIGLGFTAYADMLIKLGLSYGSKEALQFTNKLGAFIRDTAYKYSIQLAKEKGSFEKFNAEKYLESEFCKRLPEDIRHAIKKYGIRNSSLLSVAPTGTISLSVGQNCSSGIEPVFSFEQKRKIRTGNGDETTEQITYSEVFLDFKNYFEDKYNSKDIEIPSYFKTTANITPKEHIDTQSVWQKYIDNSISKTINIPREFTYEQYKDLFLYAYDAGCKGITSFWEGGALSPILSDAQKDSKTNNNLQQCTEITEHCAPKRPQDLPCEIHQIVVDHKPVLVLVGKLKDKIYEVFFDYNFTENGDKKIDVMKAKEGIIRKVRSNIYSLLIKTDEGKELIIIDNIADTFDDLAGMIARFVSLGLRYGTPLQIILNQLQKTKNFNSFTKIVARVLKKYIKNGEKVKTSDNRCPECNTELIFQDGCIICPNCGFSKCS